MPEVFMTDIMSHQDLTYSMVHSFNGAPRNNNRHLEAVIMQKQEQCTQDYNIKIVSETSINQLVTP